jgi:hypothetical protein
MLLLLLLLLPFPSTPVKGTPSIKGKQACEGTSTGNLFGIVAQIQTDSPPDYLYCTQQVGIATPFLVMAPPLPCLFATFFLDVPPGLTLCCPCGIG